MQIDGIKFHATGQSASGGKRVTILQECHLIASVRLEAMIAIARHGRTKRPRLQQFAMMWWTAPASGI
jgi:hypothetical protein